MHTDVYKLYHRRVGSLEPAELDHEESILV